VSAFTDTVSQDQRPGLRSGRSADRTASGFWLLASGLRSGRSADRTASGLAALFLLSLAARLWRLTYHSFWFDEAVSADWASRPAAEIIRVGLTLTVDKHPPVYYLLLRGWSLIFGNGDAALRSLGALMGALAIFPVYALGQRWGGRKAGAFAALLVALNPFLIWYAQEARMFVPAATFALWGLWAFTNLLDWHRRASPPLVPADGYRLIANGFAFALCTLAGLYAYLFNALLLPVVGLWWILALFQAWRGENRGRLWKPVLVSGGALALAAMGFLPLAWRAWTVSGSESAPGSAFADAGGTLWRLSHVFLVHKAPPSFASDVAVAIAGLALVVGIWVSMSTARRRGELALALVVPWLLGNLLLTRDQTTFAEPRYWLFLAPFLCLAWGVAIAWLWRRRTRVGTAAGGIVIAALLSANLVALPWNWRPEARREDWRAAAQYIATHAGPRDAILIHVDYVRLAFMRYYRGSLPVYFPFGGRLTDPALVERPLAGMAQFETIWLVESHLEGIDDDRLVERWLGERYPLVTEQFPAGIALRAYAVQTQVDALPAEAHPLASEMAPGLELAGCHMWEERLGAQDDTYHPPSGWAHVTLYWRWTADLAAQMKPRLHLVDTIGQVWGAGLERERSLWAILPLPQWPRDRLLRDDHDVNLNPATPSGDYRLLIAVVGDDGQPLGPEVICGAVQVDGKR
jgi:4-amino-4-deoxy-L-arabinose transferase-like glycosyltransferase